MEELGRKVEISEVRESKGIAMLIVTMEKLRDRLKLLEKDWEIRRNWGVRVDEGLTRKEG